MKPKTAAEYRALLLQFVASLTLCDHLGDVKGDVEAVLKRLGYKVRPREDDDETFETAVRRRLAKDGVTTLYGTSLKEDEDE